MAWVALAEFSERDEIGRMVYYHPGQPVDVRTPEQEKRLISAKLIRTTTPDSRDATPIVLLARRRKTRPDALEAPTEMNAKRLRDNRRITFGRLAICTYSRNRLGHLKQTLPVMLAQECAWRVVVTDFGSTDGTLDYLRSIKHDKLIVVECVGSEGERWSNSIPLNTGVKVACELGANLIGSVDADILLRPSWGRFVTSRLMEGAALVEAARTYMGCSITGTMAFRADAFIAIGGHDERMWGWGKHDCDFMRRVKQVGSGVRYPNRMVEHIDHGDERRGSRDGYEYNKTLRQLPLGAQRYEKIGWNNTRVWAAKGQTRDWSGCGVVYVASGDKAQRDASWSAMSTRLHNPGLPVAVAGDTLTGVDAQYIRPATSPEWGARAWKTSVADWTPFERTLFLDADTVVTGDLWTLFAALDHYDVLAAHDAVCDPRAAWHLGKQDAATLPALPGHVPQYNSGVLAFRLPGAKPLFDAWKAEWERFRDRDQGAFMRAVAAVNPRIFALGRQWNGPRDGSYIWHRLAENLRGERGQKGIIADEIDRLHRVNARAEVLDT